MILFPSSRCGKFCLGKQNVDRPDLTYLGGFCFTGGLGGTRKSSIKKEIQKHDE
jgi:hypothetical protein